jgi:hypothetical protein
MSETAEVGIVSIATNSYFTYWLEMVKSAYLAVDDGTPLSFYLFTDQPDRIHEIDQFRDKFRFSVVKIPSYTWPDATIKRYEVIHENRDLLQNRVLLYLDSDMLIQQNFIVGILELVEHSEMIFVLHPGYFRPSGFDLFLFYLSNPKMFARDTILRIKCGGLGAWETRRESAAYVPRKLRIRYVCGGTWFGLNRTFLDCVQHLKNQVTLDDDNSVMAVWHDESHLNKLASNRKFGFVDPRYCFDPRFPNLKNLPNVIEAVNKNAQ